GREGREGRGGRVRAGGRGGYAVGAGRSSGPPVGRGGVSLERQGLGSSGPSSEPALGPRGRVVRIAVQFDRTRLRQQLRCGAPPLRDSAGFPPDFVCATSSGYPRTAVRSLRGPFFRSTTRIRACC